MKVTNKRKKVSPQEEEVMEAREKLLIRSRIIELGVSAKLSGQEFDWSAVTLWACRDALSEAISLRTRADILLSNHNHDKKRRRK